jgi:hypothetical protein
MTAPPEVITYTEYPAVTVAVDTYRIAGLIYPPCGPGKVVAVVAILDAYGWALMTRPAGGRTVTAGRRYTRADASYRVAELAGRKAVA